MHVLATWLSGPFLATCVLLGWAGATKVMRPSDTRAAARAIGVPSSTRAVRVLGCVELGAAVAGTAFGGIAALGVALVFVALTIGGGRLLARAPDVPCGCLGAPGAVVSRTHVIVNASSVVVAIGAAGAGSPLAVLSSLPLAGVPFVVLVGCAARLAWLLLSVRPSAVGGR
jgi:hypothetical protein